LWRREDQILQQNPALIVMHLSSFSDPMGEVTDVAHRGRDTQEKLRAFMGYVGLGNPRTKFLIYTRYTPAELDSQKWIAESERRLPSLKGRVAIMNVAGGDERRRFEIRRQPAKSSGVSGRWSACPSVALRISLLMRAKRTLAPRNNGEPDRLAALAAKCDTALSDLERSRSTSHR
jgi:hypothetical protein